MCIIINIILIMCIIIIIICYTYIFLLLFQEVNDFVMSIDENYSKEEINSAENFHLDKILDGYPGIPVLKGYQCLECKNGMVIFYFYMFRNFKFLNNSYVS